MEKKKKYSEGKWRWRIAQMRSKNKVQKSYQSSVYWIYLLGIKVWIFKWSTIDSFTMFIRITSLNIHIVFREHPRSQKPLRSIIKQDSNCLLDFYQIQMILIVNDVWSSEKSSSLLRIYIIAICAVSR